MSLRVVLHEGGHERSLDVEQEPLAIGGEHATLELPDYPGRDPVALIVASAGRPFLQRTAPDHAPPIFLNEQPVEASRWLEGTGQLRVGELRIGFEPRGDELLLRVERIGLDESAPSGGREVIDVVPYQFGVEPPARTHWRRWPLVLGASALGLFALVGGFLLTARSVAIEVEPEAERIQIDGAFSIQLGGRWLLRPGDYALRIEKEGYQPLEGSITVPADEDPHFSFSLEPLPGYLTITTSPVAEASVSLDDTVVGRTPLSRWAQEAGTYALRVRAPLHRDVEQTLVVEGLGREQELALELVPAWAELRVESLPVGAELWVEGQAVGLTPLTTRVGEGTRDLVLRLAGYEEWKESVHVVAEQAQAVGPIELELTRGLLVLTSTPSGATVTVDGSFAGRTPLELRLAADREHALRLSHNGFKSATRQVALDTGERRELLISLSGRSGQSTPRAKPPGTGGGQPLRLRPESAPELVLLRGGALTLGTPRGQQGRRSNEALRRVELVRPFYFAITEVSNRQFHSFRAGHSSGGLGSHSLAGSDQPVVRVSWQDAAAYCNWLSEKEGLPAAYVSQGGSLVLASPPTTGYRLPTEAEWSFAAQAGPETGSTGRYPWGSGFPPPPGAGNLGGRSASALLGAHLSNFDDGYPVTSPVGHSTPNRLGIFDLAGNVSEWVNDFYASRGAAGQDPTGPASGREHAVRGSSFRNASVAELRTAFRDAERDKRSDLGFRIARYAE